VSRRRSERQVRGSKTMKKFEKLDPDRLAKAAEVFAELRADRFF
jgi:hypothetical protein